MFKLLVLSKQDKKYDNINMIEDKKTKYSHLM